MNAISDPKGVPNFGVSMFHTCTVVTIICTPNGMPNFGVLISHHFTMLLQLFCCKQKGMRYLIIYYFATPYGQAEFIRCRKLAHRLLVIPPEAFLCC